METSVEETFYERRHLPRPGAEYRPENVPALRGLIEEEGGDRSLVVLGGGEHLRQSAVGERQFDVVRTDACDRIREVDTESNTIRVEAGVTWGDLRDGLRERGWTLQRYRLQPEGATIGGLLARWRPHEKEIYTGDLREGCIALAAATPGEDDYSYLPAPRKSSGPDHRFLYIGGEGFAGVILEATLVVWPPLPGRLFSSPADDVGEAVSAYREVVGADLRISWAHWSSRQGRLEVAFHAPGPVLDAWRRRLRDAFDADFEWAESEAVEARRDELERDYPGARSADRAERTHRVEWTLDDLPSRVQEVSDDLEFVELHDWGLRRAAAHLVVRPDADPGGSAPRFASALSERRVVDRGDAIWPSWSQRLKRELDPSGRLAVGP